MDKGSASKAFPLHKPLSETEQRIWPHKSLISLKYLYLNIVRGKWVIMIVTWSSLGKVDKKPTEILCKNHGFDILS